MPGTDQRLMAVELKAGQPRRLLAAKLKLLRWPLLGRVDEFGSDEIFGIPRLNQA
jgi:hypothetical protein